MKFVVVTKEWMDEHGIALLDTMRQNKDGSKAILHYDYIEPFINEDEEANADAESTDDGKVGWASPVTYTHNSQELKDLLSSEEWSSTSSEETFNM